MEFAIQLKSAQDVQDFVCLASTRPFPVQVTNHQHSVNATNFMEMFALDVSSILFVSVPKRNSTGSRWIQAGFWPGNEYGSCSTVPEISGAGF